MVKSNLFINASTLVAGGGISIAVNFIRCLNQNYSDRYNLKFIVPKHPSYQISEIKSSDLIVVPDGLERLYKRLLLEAWVKKQAHEFGADVVFTIGNIAIPIGGIPQVVLLHFAFAVYPKSVAWKFLSFTDRLRFGTMAWVIRLRLGLADHIFVQTETMKDRLMSVTRIPGNKVSIIPNSVSLDSLSEVVEDPKRLSSYFEEEGFFSMVCLSRYYAHKNLEILVPLAKRIKSHNEKFKIYITIDESQGNGANKILNEIQENGLEDVLINIGPVSFTEIPYLYKTVEALILPTLIESFSGTYIEAMYFKKIILTSDYDFARDVCKESGFYFDPLDCDSIYNAIIKARDTFKFDKITIEEINEKYKIILDKNPGWPQLTKKIVTKIDEFM
jgi:glycosyltransferase involved in cell wall biosynthesis